MDRNSACNITWYHLGRVVRQIGSCKICKKDYNKCITYHPEFICSAIVNR